MNDERVNARLLAAVFVLLLATIWLQPRAAPLVEHDETRYAEISREMLASGDFVVPRLNGVVYYEKPPLLYWANAGAMRVFGPTPWAAKLPTRLAGLLGFVAIYVWVRRESDRLRALLAVVIAAGAPLGWGTAHINTMDGLLTLFLTLAILTAHGAVATPSVRRGFLLACSAGAACGLAFLTKGLIGILFPTAIVGIWAWRTHRVRSYLGVAPVMALAATAVVGPWIAIAARRSPEYLQVLLIREHFERYTSTIHQRHEPMFFSVVILMLAMAPVLGVFLTSLFRRRTPLTESETLLVAWFSCIVLFFSLSSSQLPSYVAPAVPAVSAFVAIRFAERRITLGAWALQATLTTLLLIGLLVGALRALPVLDDGVRQILALGALVLLAAVWMAVAVARRNAWAGAALTFLGCATFYAALVVSWPRSIPALEMRELLSTIRRERASRGAELVMYRTFPRGVPWLVKSAVPFVGVAGELDDGARAVTDPNHPIVWTETRFWARWKQGLPTMALIRAGDVPHFERRAGRVPFIAGRVERSLLVSNFAPARVWSEEPTTSTALYAPGVDPKSVSVSIAAVPAKMLSAAMRELRGELIVQARRERVDRGHTWEFATFGRIPRVVEFAESGELVYVEELFGKRELPRAVVAELRRLEPRGAVQFARREARRDGQLDRFEIVVSSDGGLREIEIDESGWSKHKP